MAYPIYRRAFHLCAFAAASLAAQTPAPQPAQAPAVHLTLRIPTSQTRFHIGETIPVQLTFTTSDPGIVHFGEDCFPHSAYRYHVTPGGFTDRASERDAALIVENGMGCHGWSEPRDVLAKPLTVDHDLNDRFRMETPGIYHVSVTVYRTGTPLTSNSIDVEILPPDPAWDQQQLDEAITLIDSPSTNPNTQQKRREACTTLAYLDTPAAELELARRYDSPALCSQTQALINARNRKQVLDTLEAGLADSNRPITQQYLRLLAIISVYQQHPEWYPKPLSPEEADALQSIPRHAFFGTSGITDTAGVTTEELRYASTLNDAVPRKIPEPRAVSLRTLLDFGTTLPFTSIPPEFAATAREQLPAVFRTLPHMDQNYLLQYDWRALNSPAMLPVLRDILTQNNMSDDRSLALQHLYELSPTEGREIILTQLQSPQPKYGAATLSILPDKQLPQLDTLLLERLRKDIPGYADFGEVLQLVNRYASPAIAPQLRAEFVTRFPDAPMSGGYYLVTYFLRVDPPTGREMLFRVLNKPGPVADQFLRTIAQVSDSPEIERIALSLLDNPNPNLASEALDILRIRGSAANRQTLMAHFRAWNQRSKSHIDPSTQPTLPDGNLDRGYALAIGAAQKWLATSAELAQLQSLCLNKSCQDLTRQMVEAEATAHHTIDLWPPAFGRPFNFTVGQFSDLTDPDRLEEKLLQFPTCNDFTLQSRFGRETDLREVYAQLHPWALQHNITLTLKPTLGGK